MLMWSCWNFSKAIQNCHKNEYARLVLLSCETENDLAKILKARKGLWSCPKLVIDYFNETIFITTWKANRSVQMGNFTPKWRCLVSEVLVSFGITKNPGIKLPKISICQPVLLKMSYWYASIGFQHRYFNYIGIQNIPTPKREKQS